MKNQFVAVLQLLCLPYEEQSVHYPAFVYPPEAIISAIYDDMLVYKETLLEEGFLNEEIYEQVQYMEDITNKFVDKNGIDFPLECIDTPEWKEISFIARTILSKMGYNLEPPDKKWI